MKAKSSILTKEERDVLILTVPHPCGQHLNNTEIGQCLGISATRVKTLIHQACAKLKAHNRNEAIFFAVRRGEIRPDEFYSLEELAEIFTALHPDIFRRTTHLEVREDLEHGYLPGKNDTHTIIIKNAKLTKSERDVLILVGRGLKNKEIADTLYISINAVNTFLYRPYTTLGTHNRVGAVVLALKRGEINVTEIYSINELVRALTTLGAESLDKIAQLIIQKHEQKPVLTGS